MKACMVCGSSEFDSSLTEVEDVRYKKHHVCDTGNCMAEWEREQRDADQQEYDDAITVFRKVADNEAAGTELRAESLYWAADCYMRRSGAKEGRGGNEGDLKEAYLLFKSLTLYYPESKWARYARGRLAGDSLSSYDAPPEEDEKK